MFARRLMTAAIVVATWCALGNSWVSAQAQKASPRDQHAWGKFEPGAWKSVRLLTETLNEAGQVEGASQTEAKTTLVATDDKWYRLQIEVTVDVAGKRLQAEPKEVTYGYHGELQGQTTTVEQLGPGIVMVQGQSYNTSVSQVVIHDMATRSISKVYYSSEQPPFQLLRTTTALDEQTKTPSFESVVAVTELNCPTQILTELLPASRISTVETYANGTVRRIMETHCPTVPGGVVAQQTEQLNAAGAVVQRSTMELLAYHGQIQPDLRDTVSTSSRRARVNRRRGN